MDGTIEIRRIVGADGEPFEATDPDVPPARGGPRIRAHVVARGGQAVRPGWSLEWRWPDDRGPLARASAPGLRPEGSTRTSASHDA